MKINAIHTSRFRNIRNVVIASSCLAYLTGSASAQLNYHWSGAGANNNMTTAGNFQDAPTGNTNATPTSTDQNIFNFGTRAATVTTANNSTATAGFNIHRVNFENTVPASFTLSGSEIEFKKQGSTDPIITQNTNLTQTISAPIKVAESLTFNGSGSGSVFLTGTKTFGSKGLIKSGSFAVISTGANSNSGTVTVNGGTLALGSGGTLAGGVIQLRGGVFAQSGTFSRALGTGATNVNFGAGGGGFAAYAGALTVSTDLGTWGAANSVAAGTPLILGSNIADNVVTLSGNLSLGTTGTATREIRLVDNINSSADRAVISGIISGIAGIGLNLTGQGSLAFTAANTYAGLTTIDSGATLLVGDGGTTGTLGSGNVTNNSSLIFNRSNDFSVGNLISGSGAVFKQGNGTVTLTGANTYSGSTTVTQGTLALSSTGTIINSSVIDVQAGAVFDTTARSTAFTVAAGQTLKGVGTIKGATTISGTLAPGASPGTLTFENALTLSGTTVMEIDGLAGAGVNPGGHDFINLVGTGAEGLLTYGGVLSLEIGALFDQGAYSWDLFDFASQTGSFSSITLGGLYSGNLAYNNLNGVWNLTSDNNLWTFTQSTGVLGLTVIPEPASALLGGLGLLVLLRRRR